MNYVIVLLAITTAAALDHMEELQQDIELASANTPKADAPGVGAAQIADAIKKDKDDVKAGKIDKATAEKQAKKLLARFESVQIENAVKKAQDTINKAGGTDADAEKAATMIKQGLAAASKSGFFDEAAVRQKTKELLAKFEGGKIKDAIKKAKDVACEDNDAGVKAATGGAAPNCGAAADKCKDPKFRATVRASCRKTCGVCKGSPKKAKNRPAKMNLKFSELTEEVFEKKKAKIIEQMSELMKIPASRITLRLQAASPDVKAPAKTPASAPAKTQASAPAISMGLPRWAKTPASAPAKTPASAPAKTPASAPAKTPASAPAKTPASAPAKTPASASAKHSEFIDEFIEFIDLGTYGAGDSAVEAVIKDATPEEEAKAKEVLAGSALKWALISKLDLKLESAEMVTAAPSSASLVTTTLIGSLLAAISLVL